MADIETRKLKIDASVLVKQVVNAFDISRDDSQIVRQNWKRNWQLYNNQYDFTEKSPWQSQNFVPKIPRAVDALGGMLKKALTENKAEWFRVDPVNKEAEPVIPVKNRLALENLEREDFAKKFKSQMINGLLTCSPAFKVYPIPDGPWPGYCRIEPLDMRCCFRDPSGQNRFKILVTLMDYADLMRLAEASGYDTQAVKRLSTQQGTWDDDDSWKNETASMLEMQDALRALRKPVFLMEYWGPIYDSEGDEVMPFGYQVVGNRTELLYGPIEKPYGDNEGCIIDGDIQEKPFAPYGKSFVEDTTGLADSLTKLLNIILDGLAYSTAKAYEVNVNVIRGHAQLKTGIRPGMVVQKETSEKAVLALDTGGFHNETIGVYQLLDQEFQAASFITDYVRGLPAHTGTKESTLGEVQLKRSAVSDSLSDMATEIEDRVLEPLIARLLYFIGEYTDLSDPVVQFIAGEQIEKCIEALMPEAQEIAMQRMMQEGVSMDPMTGTLLRMDPVEGIPVEVPAPNIPDIAYSLMAERLSQENNVHVRGLSSVLEQEQELMKYQQAVSMLMQTPLGPRINWDKAGVRMLEMAGIQPDEVLYSDEEWAVIQQQQMMAQMQMMGQMAQGGMNAEGNTGNPGGEKGRAQNSGGNGASR